MSEYQSYDLPLEIDENDLRYVMPEFFAAIAAEEGWTFTVEEDVDNNHYKVLYALSRRVPPDFDDSMVAQMQDRIGIVDEDGEILDDYGLFIEEEDVWKDDNTALRLFFEFEGFPADQTMDIMERVLESFPSETESGRWTRILGYLGLRKTQSET